MVGADILETVAADQTDGTIAGMSCVDCMEWLERKYGTSSSAHVKKLIAALQSRCERPVKFPMHCTKFNRPIRRLNRAQMQLDNAYTTVSISRALYQYLLESILHVPQFILLIASFGTSHSVMAQQMHQNL